MGIMRFMLKSQRRASRWPNNLCARLYMLLYTKYTAIRKYKIQLFTKKVANTAIYKSVSFHNNHMVTNLFPFRFEIYLPLYMRSK